MKKLFSALLAGLLMATTVAASDIGECKGLVPQIAEGIIQVDGVKDAAYDEALVVDINQYLVGDEDNAATAKAYMLWAKGAFYFLAEVNDADVVIPTSEVQNDKPWETDSVEMFFDFGNEHADLVQQFRVDCSGFPSYYSEGGVDSAYGPELAAPYFDGYAVTMTDAGYNVEMYVNLEKYGLAEGQSIGLNLQVNDMLSTHEGGGTDNQRNMVSSLGAGSWDADFYDYVTLGAMLDIQAPVVEEPAAEPEAPAAEPEAPAAEPEAPAAEPEVVAPVVVAPQTFDAGIIAAVSAIIALAGVALNKKR